MSNQPPPIVSQIAELAIAGSKKKRNATFCALARCLRTLQQIVDRPGRVTDTPEMTTDEFLSLLRAATEDDVEDALEDAHIELPITTSVEALELFNRMLDVLTGESDAAEAMDAARLASARRGSD